MSKTPRKIIEPSRKHTALMDAFKVPIGTIGADMDALEILAVLSQVVGQLIAVQDKRLGAAYVMDVVSRNIEIGNAVAVQGLGNS